MHLFFLYAKETYVFYVDIKYVDKSKINQNNCTARYFFQILFINITVKSL